MVDRHEQSERSGRPNSPVKEDPTPSMGALPPYILKLSRNACRSRSLPIYPGLHYLADCDPTKRPNYSNFVLVSSAILGSPNQRLTAAEIYQAISDRFPYFATAGGSWKSSVRHTLSLDKKFQRIPRSPTEPGKGCFWTYRLDYPNEPNRPHQSSKHLPTWPQVTMNTTYAIPISESDIPTSFPLKTRAWSPNQYDTIVPPNPTPVPLTRMSAQITGPSGWTSYYPMKEVIPELIPLSSLVELDMHGNPIVPNSPPSSTGSESDPDEISESVSSSTDHSISDGKSKVD